MQSVTVGQTVSWKASAFAKATRGHPNITSKAVLMVLADYYNDEQGMAWCSQDTIAADCEITTRSVRTAIKILEGLGFIKQTQKGNQYQPSHYVFLFAGTQSQVPELSGPEHLSGASEPEAQRQVNRKTSVGEPEAPRHTNPQEPIKELEAHSETEVSSLLEERPEWFQTLSQDPRWTGANPDRYIKQIESDYGGKVNLNLEAHNAYEWLQTAKGQKKKVLRGFWTNWLKTSLKDAEGARGNQPKATTEEDPTAKHKQAAADIAARYEAYYLEHPEKRPKAIIYDN